MIITENRVMCVKAIGKCIPGVVYVLEQSWFETYYLKYEVMYTELRDFVVGPFESDNCFVSCGTHTCWR